MDKPVLVTIPQETVNDETVRILSWKVASGSIVQEGQILCEVETSKAVMDIESPTAGVAMYRAHEGDEIPIGATICQIVPTGAEAQWEGEGNAILSPLVPEIAQVAAVPPAPVEEVQQAVHFQKDSAPQARLTKLAQKIAQEFGFSPESFPRGAIVRRDDVLRRAGKLPMESVEEPLPLTLPVRANAGAEKNAPVAGVPVTWTELPRRKAFEIRMLGQGQAGTIRSSVTATVNVGHLRSRLTRLWKTGLGITALAVFECSRLLLKFKELNAVHDRGRVGVYEQINIGWAIDGGNGLMVPVISHADSRSPVEMVGQMTFQYESYTRGALTPADFLGGTFTISDLSSEGIAHFQPLISQGQCAILGIGSQMDGEENEWLSLTLSFDHQVTEGKQAAQFLKELARRLRAHGLREDSPFDAEARAVEPCCARCARNAAALRELNGFLLKTEYPAGFVCSVCLMGK